MENSIMFPRISTRAGRHVVEVKSEDGDDDMT
jgi:hypothetical protein